MNRPPARRTGVTVERLGPASRADAASLQSPPLLLRLLSRARIDLLASVFTLVLSGACLGAVMWFTTILGRDLVVPHEQLERWGASSLPCASLLVFALGYKRFVPWFAGIVASLVAFFIPGLPLLVRFGLLLALALILGAADILTRERMARQA